MDLLWRDEAVGSYFVSYAKVGGSIPSPAIRFIKNMYPRGSTDQSAGLRIRRLGVQVSPGVPNNAPVAERNSESLLSSVSCTFKSCQGLPLNL